MKFKLGFDMGYTSELIRVFSVAAQRQTPDLASLSLPRMVETRRALGFKHLEIPMDAILMIPGAANSSAWDQLNASKTEEFTFSIHLPFIDVHLSSLNETIRQGSVATVKDALNQCAPLDVEGYVLHLFTELEEMVKLPPVPFNAQQGLIPFLMNAAKRSIREILDLIPPQKLFLENLESMPAEVVIQLAEEFDTKLCLDVGHAGIQFREPISLIKLFRNRLGEIHLHDITRRSVNKNITLQEDHQALGTGWLDIPRFFEALEAIDFNGPIVLEMSVEQALTSLNVLRQLGIIE